jgi:CTP synthase
MKYVFFTGGVVSSLGKGIAAASLGRLLKARGLSVSVQKLDPYLNVDAGTMNPYQHGEVFVTEDGAETDLDLGHYERFIDENLSSSCNTTTGKVYQSVIEKERRGDYLGATIQVIPHVTGEIKSRIVQAAHDAGAEICIVEIGGTVGDIESLPFLEAIRQMRQDLGAENVAYVHLTLVPHLGAADEMKTKPTQHSVRELRGIGITPDAIVCRTDGTATLDCDLKRKIALFCDVSPQAVIHNPDAETIYAVPANLEDQGLAHVVLTKLAIEDTPPDLASWNSVVDRIKQPRRHVTIALVGKYVGLKDAYISISEAFIHAAVSHDAHVDVVRIDSEALESDPEAFAQLEAVDGIFVGPGFGARGIKGKIAAIRYARENLVPFLGVCYGMQLACVEFAQHVAGLPAAMSTEIEPETADPVIDIMRDQRNQPILGGTMRLGSYGCDVARGTLAFNAYGSTYITERHRHRYEFNNRYRPIFEELGLKFSGIHCASAGQLVEIVELPASIHPWFVGTQAHPEFKSRPDRPSPLYRDFILAALQRKLRTWQRAASPIAEVHRPAPPAKQLQ